MTRISIRILVRFALPAALLLAGFAVYYLSPSRPANQVRVRFQASVPPAAPFDVEVAPKEILFKPGEPFTATLTVTNRSQREVWAKASHNVEPEIMAKYMGMLDCGSFLPFHLGPGQKTENTSTYLIWTDIPGKIRRFTLTYQFEMDKE
jgi:cytochrome c oxidase assembly protein Cox11